MGKRIFIILAGLTVAGCATTQYYPEEARQDWINCTSQIDSDQSYGIGPLAQVARNMAYERCMKNAGWNRIR